MTSTDRVQIYEVAPRDGLQNEPGIVDTDHKVGLIERLACAGLRDIEVTSFVRPSHVPQLADAHDLVMRLPRLEGVRYWALVPNQVGLDRALSTGLSHVATVVSASEVHNQRNLNRTRRETMASLTRLIKEAVAGGAKVRAYISTAFGCAMEGDIPAERPTEMALALLQAGASQVALGDTDGLATPKQVRSVLSVMDRCGVDVGRLAVHLHDTHGRALANAVAAFEGGVRTFDGSVAGVGGCPFSPGAAGNAATEDLVGLLESMGIDTGIDQEALAETGAYLSSVLDRPLPGRVHRYWMGRQAKGHSKTA